jgi:hypothetical protein
VSRPRPRPRREAASALPLVVAPLVFASIGLYGCEQRFSANPPPYVLESRASSSSSVDPLFAPRPDAGAVVQDVSRALTITLCSAGAQSCGTLEAGAAGGESYHVVFGSGRGEVRSRGQAIADLYEDLRNRTSAGEWLDAEPHPPGDAGTSVATGTVSLASGVAVSADALSRCARHLLDVVDEVGEMDINVIHGSGSKCLVSLGQPGTNDGASKCLILEPERPHRIGLGGK